MSDQDLTEFFAAARSHEMPQTLQERLRDEAVRLRPAPPAPAAFGSAAAEAVRSVLDLVLGGWRGASGLSAALVAGLWFGFADPAGLLSDLAVADTIDLLPASDGLLAGFEGG
jgi:hypothetical protein